MRGLIVVVSLTLALTACDPSSGESDRRPRSRPGADGDISQVDPTVAGMVEHLEALQEIADANGGTRAAGTPGYEASVRYVADTLEAAGYEVSLQGLAIDVFEVRSPGTIRVQGGPSLDPAADFKEMLYSAPGRVSGTLLPLAFDAETSARSGPACDPESLEDVAPGAVVLIRPGPCLFRDQVTNVQGAGAGAVLFSFTEYSDDRAVLRPTLIAPDGIDIPVFALSDEAGVALSQHSGATIEVEADVATSEREVDNVIAESGGSGTATVMAGGHLDSVLDGPGINDNGSGVAVLLETAEEMADVETEDRLRFGFWAAEELGLLGSSHYVRGLSSDQKDEIEVYLNFDMLGSPNHVNYVYDDTGAPEFSEEVTDLFKEHFETNDIPLEEIDLAGRSDHGPFLAAGIPVGGLFTGADMVKSEEEERDFGGVVGDWEDPCYHQACDDLGNVDTAVLEDMAAAVAHAIATLSASG